MRSGAAARLARSGSAGSWVLLAALLLTHSLPVLAQQELVPAFDPSRRVAITIDDLPLADLSRHDRADRLRIVEALCAIIRERELPVTGFFNMARHRDDERLLPVWLQCGIRLGNHTWSHPRLSEVSVDDYLADLERGHRAVGEIAGAGAAIPFRYPYLAEGFDPAVRDRIRARLAELGSPIAPVTIDTMDWYHARRYSTALREGEAATAERCHQAYLWNAEEATEYAEVLSRQLFGREPPQILLLHGNEINADHLGDLLDWLQRRGYSFVSLDEALADPAYAEPDRSVSPTGDSHWLRLRRSRQLGDEHEEQTDEDRSDAASPGH